MSASGRINRVRPGDEIVTYCGRCRQERTHQIVALNSGGVADRVICRFCQSNHIYRESKTGAKRASISKNGQTAGDVRGSSQVTGIKLRSYAGNEVYVVGDVILHQKFGQGRVVETRGGKIDVKFGSELRTLLHAG